jgi:hypothetical protein
VADTRLTTDLAPPEAGPAERRRDAWALGTANDALLDPAPPGTNLAIEYPVRAFPDQENFNLPTCSDLEFESVLLHNVGAVAVPLGGWTLSDEEDNVYTFPPVVIPPDGYTRIWTKSGPDTALGPFVDLYWNRAEGVWNGPGASAPWDVATVRDDAGAVIAQRGYP